MADAPATALLGDLESLTKDPKATDDFGEEARQVIAKAQTLAAAGRLEEAVEAVLAVERKARQASDGQSVSKMCCAVLTLHKERELWDELCEYTVLLCKRRGQLKRAVSDMLSLAMSWLEGIENREKKLMVLQTLTKVTEGKIFVECDRARLIRMEAHMKEKEGDIAGAATLLQEVQVETFGAMDKIEKAEYILDQMRLILLKEDFVRCQVISKKINPKLLQTDEFQDIKLRYYNFLVQYWLHEEDLLEVARCFHQMLQTKRIYTDRDEFHRLLQPFLLFLILAPYGNDQHELLVKADLTGRKMLDLPVFERLVKDFLTEELMAWPPAYEEELRNHEIFSDSPYRGGAARWELLRIRVIQHNVKVLAKYYKKIRLARAAHLLGISVDEVEKQIAELVNSKFLAAKIDRPAGVVQFGRKTSVTGGLDDWTGDTTRLLNLVEESSFLIEKERMVHAARAKRAALKA